MGAAARVGALGSRSARTQIRRWHKRTIVSFAEQSGRSDASDRSLRGVAEHQQPSVHGDDVDPPAGHDEPVEDGWGIELDLGLLSLR